MYSGPTGRLVPLWVLPKCTLDLLGAWFLCGSSRNVLISTGRLVPLWVLPKCTHIYWAPGSSVEMYSYLDLLGAWFLCGSEMYSGPTGRLVPLWKCTHIYWAPGSSVGPKCTLDLLGAWFLCGNVLLTYWAPGSSVGPLEMYSQPTGRLVPLWVLPKCTLDLLGAWFLCGSSRNVLIS